MFRFSLIQNTCPNFRHQSASSSDRTLSTTGSSHFLLCFRVGTYSVAIGRKLDHLDMSSMVLLSIKTFACLLLLGAALCYPSFAYSDCCNLVFINFTQITSFLLYFWNLRNKVSKVYLPTLRHVTALKYFSNRPGPLSLLYDPVEVLSSQHRGFIAIQKTIWEQ